MSYSLVPYLIDIAQVESAVGSKDESIIDNIRKRHPELFDSASRSAPLSVALSELILGTPLERRRPPQYSHALEWLCDEFGTRLNCNVLSGIRWDAMQDSGIADLIRRGSTPLALSFVPDFPFVGVLPRSVCQGMAESLGDDALVHSVPELQEMLEEFEGWIREAARKNLDLMFFYY